MSNPKSQRELDPSGLPWDGISKDQWEKADPTSHSDRDSSRSRGMWDHLGITLGCRKVPREAGGSQQIPFPIPMENPIPALTQSWRQHRLCSGKSREKSLIPPASRVGKAGRELLPQLDATKIQSNPRFWIPRIPGLSFQPSQLPTGIQPLDVPQSHSQSTPFPTLWNSLPSQALPLPAPV